MKYHERNSDKRFMLMLDLVTLIAAVVILIPANYLHDFLALV
jgi:hypothetical protein